MRLLSGAVGGRLVRDLRSVPISEPLGFISESLTKMCWVRCLYFIVSLFVIRSLCIYIYSPSVES